MTAAPGRKPPGRVVPALSTTVMLVVLLGLGTWQVQRRDWKLGVLAQIGAAEQNPPVPLGPSLPPFAKVTVTGTLRPDLAAYYGAEARDLRGGTVLGAQMIVPLQRPNAKPVLVDLGWVADGERSSLALPSGETSVTGFIRPGETPGWFAPSDDVAGRRFYTLNPEAIAAAVGLPAAEPFVLVALGDAPAKPDPARHLPTLPNNHLQYAITWYSLAAVLAAVFVLYRRKAARA